MPVEEVSLASFAQGRAIWARAHRESRFDRTEVIRRARSRLGEDRYRILSNNCEHLCEWCLRGEQRSYQVESLLALPRRLARAILSLGQLPCRFLVCMSTPRLRSTAAAIND